MKLLQEMADILRSIEMENISLIAGGGLVDGRGTAACLARGACGVAMDTRRLGCKGSKTTEGEQRDARRKERRR